MKNKSHKNTTHTSGLFLSHTVTKAHRDGDNLTNVHQLTHKVTQGFLALFIHINISFRVSLHHVSMKYGSGY